MRLLFVKPKHIGDVLLLTPTLMAVRDRYPTATIWVVVRQGTEGILVGCPAIDRVLTTAAPEVQNRGPLGWVADLRLIAELRRQRIDHVFELSDTDRGRYLAVACGAQKRTTNCAYWPQYRWWRRCFDSLCQFDWITAHTVERDYRTVQSALPLPEAIPPLSFARDRTETWAPATAEEPFVVLHPGARWQQKQWPMERWLAVAQSLATRFPRLIISAGPDPDEVRRAAELERALNGRAISTAGQLSWRQLAGLLHRAQLFVGVDTAAMHLAAACGTPVVTLFGPSDERVWRPWQVQYELVAPPGVTSPTRRMEDIPVAQVLAACERMLA